MPWYAIALGYFVYLVLVSLTRPEFSQVRRPLAAGALAASLLTMTGVLFEHRPDPLIETLLVVVPAVVLLIGYQLTGLLFVRTDRAAEAWFRAIDDRLLHRSGILAWYRGAPSVISEILELSYFLVYPAVPAGAAILAVSGFGAAVDRFWTIVLLSEFACYGVLPWLQTRPPMLLEDPDASIVPPGLKALGSVVTSTTWQPMRRFNQFVAASASIRANTIPSGHVAGALATALVVGESLPAIGAVFMALAVMIAIASVLGRYHYFLDAVLGAGVAFVIWAIL